MFGRRPDGRRINALDPIIRFTPYIMPQRTDATNLCKQTADYAPIADYIKKKRLEGHNISFLSVAIAAYVRTVAEYPRLNRFIVNKQIFARNRIDVAFAIIKENGDKENPEEALIKLEFHPKETIFEISERVEAAIAEARKQAEENNAVVHFANTLLAIPGLTNLFVGLARLLDRYGLAPEWIIRLSPFHTSMFITNLASVGLPYIYHHIYNFGTTSQFMSLGKAEKAVVRTTSGLASKNVIPIGTTTDERICGGADYAICFAYMRSMLADPERLETPPERVNYDIDFSARQDREYEKRKNAK